MGKRSLFIQTESLNHQQITDLVTKAKNDPDVEAIILHTWDLVKAQLIKNIIPYSSDGKYKRLIVGLAKPSAQDYTAILSDEWRWASVTSASAVALEAAPYADGWYIPYETGMNVFESEEFRSRWEWYLGDLVRRLRAVRDIPIVWSPYLFGPLSAPAVQGWARTMKLLGSWYSPGVKFECHVQDGVGAQFQTQASAIMWLKALKAADSGVTVKVNVEWFALPGYTPVNAYAREAAYAAAGIAIGAAWEIRYWAAVEPNTGPGVDPTFNY